MKQRKLPTINLNQFRLSRITIHLNQTHTQGGICGTWLYYVHNILLSLSLLFHVVSLWMVWATNTECEKWWCYFNIHLWLVWQSVLWYSIVYVLTMGVLDLYWNTKGEYFHLYLMSHQLSMQCIRILSAKYLHITKSEGKKFGHFDDST